MKPQSFTELQLQAGLQDNLSSLGYNTMTAIQAASLPLILQGKDVIGQAKTGSGKTAAFGLGLLNKLDVKRFCVQSLLLCPTRELADQVAKEIRKLARAVHNIKVLTLCGGMPMGPQIGSLKHGAHIIVGTPGRVHDHLRKSTLQLNNVEMLVLDEADRMLDSGFQETLDAIIEQVPKQRQTLLFSATYPEQIQEIAQRIMQQAVFVQAGDSHDKNSIDQQFYKIDAAQNNPNDKSPSSTELRMTALRLLLLHHRPDSSLVFCNTKKETQEIADQLSHYGFSALALHGDLEQKARDQILVRFSNKSASILVATDVAARGLDIDSLDAVINYQIARELDVHVHRVGRTGRAGSKGFACTLYNEKEQFKLDKLANLLAQTIDPLPLPPVSLLQQPGFKAPMATLQIDGGKKQKLRPGDILGALTGEDGIAGQDVGKISLFDQYAYVAVSRKQAAAALDKLNRGKLKGRSFKVRRIRG